MSKNPLINALSAALYIALVVTVMQNAPNYIDEKASILIPIAILSLFVLSAAVMGLFFLAQPFQLCFEGKIKEGSRHFLKTISSFAIITALFAATLFLI